MCFLLACFPLFSQGFCDKRTSNNVYIILVHSSTVHALYIEIWSTWKVQWTLKKGRKTITHLLKFHTRSARIRGFTLEFVTLRVTQFVLKIAHLAISMEPRTCGLLLYYPDYGSGLKQTLTYILTTKIGQVRKFLSVYFGEYFFWTKVKIFRG